MDKDGPGEGVVDGLKQALAARTNDVYKAIDEQGWICPDLLKRKDRYERGRRSPGRCRSGLLLRNG